MNVIDETTEKNLKTVTIITWAMLVLAPIAYLVVGWLMRDRAAVQAGGVQAGKDVLVYILFVLAMVQPAMAFVIARFHISQFKTNPQSGTNPVNLFTTLSIIKMAMVEVIYIYGLVCVFLTAEFQNMLYFYPVGLVWSVVHWPTRARYLKLEEELTK